MSNADVLSAQLLAAGFKQATFERFDVDLCVGETIEDAVAFAMELGPAGEILRLAGGVAITARPKVMASLRDLLAGFARPGGVFMGSSTWLVSARAG